jgi:hypothetical protein
MADNPQTLSAVLTSLAQNFRPRVVRTMNRRSQTMKTLPVVAGEGKNIAVDIEFDGMIVENFNDGDDAVNFGSDAVAPATLPWGLYRANFRVTDLARATARTSRSPQGLLALWGRNLVNASAKLSSNLNAEAYAGPGTGTRMTGFGVAVHDTNTYMGIDRSQAANAGFRGNVIDPGAPTKPTLDLIRGDINTTIYDKSGETPDLAFCPSAVFNKLGSLFTELRRYNQSVEMTTAKGRVTLDASVGAIEFEGCTFIKDKDATANQIVYVNSNYVRFEYLPQQDEEEVMSQGNMQPLDDGYGPIPLGARFKKLATLGSSEKATMQVFINLVVEKPIACGIRKNVDVT